MTDDVLNRYFANQITPEEAQRVLTWFDTDEGRAYLVNRLDKQFGQPNWQTTSPLSAPAADPLWQRLNEARQSLSAQPTPVIRPLTSWRQPMRWAAVFVGALLIALGSFWLYTQRQPAELTYQTPFGKIRTLTLSDGSVVTLNGNSRLRLTEQWRPGQAREVWLDGEGFFRVTHQQNHERFVVHLPNKLNIEVLGTQFNVLARASRAKVVLTNGKIRLDVGERAKEKLIMRPGDLVFADINKRIYYRKRVDPAVQSSWQADKLRFEGTTLQEVADMLRETYGVDVVITNPELGRQTLSGSVPNNSVETILNGLSTLFDLRITRKGNQILIQ
ncbi:ferric-dicitrate binding protein FerR (iron transport regulator) [Spirosoma lacussanchae]|uniref:FecR family protein n=1 Tax=Spirosoma lacussanchae TaxID=1884249 RepID=UPI00110954CA|nr:FecR domain-containing protein [Spirosoma lacussanchae]